MPRKARIMSAGLFVHVMSRGIDGLTIFKQEQDKEFILSEFTHRLIRAGHQCYAWVLMDNHFHFLLHTSEQPLSVMMRGLNMRYAQYFNKKYQRKGPLFQDRYKSIVTQDQMYVENLIAYIHLNPIKAGICKSMSSLIKYPWSGHSVLMGKRICEFQQVWPVLRRFGKSIQQGRIEYLNFMTDQLKKMHSAEKVDFIEEQLINVRKTDPGCWVIGDHEFVKKDVLAKEQNKKLQLSRYVMEKLTVGSIAERYLKKWKLDKGFFFRRYRNKPWSDYKKIFAYECRYMYGFPVKDIANYFHMQPGAVSIAIEKGRLLLEK